MISLEVFKQEIAELIDDDKKRIFTQKYFFSGLPIIFNSNESDYFEFKRKISQHFKVNHYDIYIVGSSKLGFSPYKLTEFNLNSDVDVVISNEKLFDYFFEITCQYQYKIRQNIIRLDNSQLKSYDKFIKYFMMGWMRPDLIPTNSNDFKLIRDEWDNFFKSLSYGKSEVGNYKVKGGLFKNLFFAERYYLTTIDEIRTKLNY
jgi:hypothetical protein